MFWKFLAGYLYNFQTKEFYNLSYAHEPPQGPARFGGLLTCVFQFQLFDFLKWYLDFVFFGGVTCSLKPIYLSPIPMLTPIEVIRK